MPETFLILLCGGVMFASAVPKARDVTLHWLRLCGIIAVTMLALSAFFWTRRVGIDREALAEYLSVGVLTVIQLLLVQVAIPSIARIAAIMAFCLSLPLSVHLLGRPTNVPYGAALVGCAGVATLCGVIL